MATPADQIPPLRNGTDSPHDPIDTSGSDDRRILYFIIGGMLLAFSIGVVILMVAAMSDWQ
jgi:hypothetical protein